MAIKGVRLIERGCMDEFFTLILDAGSMRAGKKFQAAVASFYDEGASSEFTTFVLGSIPLACGTDEHRMQRTFEIFEDLVLAVQHLGKYFSEDPAVLNPSMENMLQACEAFLGDHGEASLLRTMEKKMRDDGLGSESLQDEKVNSLYFCHFHKLINIYDAAMKGMACREEDLKASEEREDAVINGLDETYPDTVAVATQPRSFRRAGKNLAYSTIWDVCCLVGAAHNANESMYQGHKMDLLRNAAFCELKTRWTNLKGARGSSAIFENAGSALLLLLDKSENGLLALIDALVYSNSGRTNNLYRCIQAVSGNMLVAAEMSVMYIFSSCMFVHYRAYANTCNQNQMLGITQQMVKVLRVLKENPCAVRDLLFFWDPGDVSFVRLCHFGGEVRVSRQHTELVEFCLSPGPQYLTPEQNEIFQAHSLQMIQSLADHVLQKIGDLCAPIYGNAMHKMFPAEGLWVANEVLRVQLDQSDPKQTSYPTTTSPDLLVDEHERGNRVQAASTAVESIFGLQDLIMRMFPGLSDLHVHAYICIHDENMATVLGDIEDEDLLDRMVRDAIKFVKQILKPRWNARTEQVKIDIVAKLRAAQAAMKAKAEGLCLFVQELTGKSVLWEKNVETTVDEYLALTTKKAREDYLKEKLRILHLVHELDEHPVFSSMFRPNLPRDSRVIYQGKLGADAMLLNVLLCVEHLNPDSPPLWIRRDPHTLRIRRDRLRIFVFARTALHITRCADDRDATRAAATRKAAAAATERAAKKRKGSHVGAEFATDYLSGAG
jgi:hypothetical protein